MQGKSKTSQEALVNLGQKTGLLFISHPTAFPLTHIHKHIFILHSLFDYSKSALRLTSVLDGLFAKLEALQHYEELQTPAAKSC